MFFPLFPPHCYLAPGHPAANARGRALGLRSAGKNDALLGRIPGLPPNVWSPFSPKSMRFCPRMPSSPSRSWGEHRLLFRTRSHGLESARGHGQLGPPSCREPVLPGRTGAAPPGVEGLSGPCPHYPVFVRYGSQALCGSAEVRRLLPQRRIAQRIVE